MDGNLKCYIDNLPKPLLVNLCVEMQTSRDKDADQATGEAFQKRLVDVVAGSFSKEDDDGGDVSDLMPIHDKLGMTTPKLAAHFASVIASEASKLHTMSWALNHSSSIGTSSTTPMPLLKDSTDILFIKSPRAPKSVAKVYADFAEESIKPLKVNFNGRVLATVSNGDELKGLKLRIGMLDVLGITYNFHLVPALPNHQDGAFFCPAWTARVIKPSKPATTKFQLSTFAFDVEVPDLLLGKLVTQHVQLKSFALIANMDAFLVDAELDTEASEKFKLGKTEITRPMVLSEKHAHTDKERRKEAAKNENKADKAARVLIKDER